MTSLVLAKLAAIFLTCGLGYAAARWRWLGDDAAQVSRIVSALAFTLLIPALLFRTTLRLDLEHLPWRTVAAYYVPALTVLLGVYAWQRWRVRPAEPALPAARSIAGSFGNSVQLGIPVATAVFGEPGLAIHVTLVSLHTLILITVPTALAEFDLARAHAREHGAQPVGQVLLATLRNTLLHPVVLPVLAGLSLNFAGLRLPAVLDEVLASLAAAAVPLCLLLIGISLAAYGVGSLTRHGRSVVVFSGIKLLLMPAVVWAVAQGLFGLSGLPLAVAVIMAAGPAGANALLFAERYGVNQAEATAVIVASTLAFVATVTLWLALLARWG